MAEKSYFFNDVNDDRVYLAEDFALFFSTLIGNGVFPNPSTNTQVLVNEEIPMSITIKPGFAWINGYLYWNPDNLVKTLATAYTNPRIDRVVIRWLSNNREIRTDVITGIPAAVPVAPELTRNSDVWELGIADIFVGGGVTSITQANITDTRLSNALCGIVHALVDQVDTEDLFIQFQDAFQIWFESVKSILNEDVAGNLLNLINDNTDDIAVHTTALSTNSNSIIAIDERLEEAETNIISLDSRLDNQERLITSTITTSWTGTAAPFTQTITISGITSSDKPVISPVFSTTLATAVLQKEAWNQISKIETGSNSIMVTCFEDKPVTAIPIQIKGA